MKQKNLILMVVAVGCGLVAAFLTSQMSAKGQVEQVEVYIASKDLPVGTLFTADEVEKHVKLVKRPKDGLSPKAVTNKEELIGKRLFRPIRADAVLDSQDLSDKGVIMLPEGYHMTTMSIGRDTGGGGFVNPGDRVNILATFQTRNKLLSFKLLVNVLVMAVDTNVGPADKGVYQQMSTVSFAVTERMAQLLALAKHRGCRIELLLLNQKTYRAEEDKDYDIEKVLALLVDEKKSEIHGSDPDENGGGGPDPKDPKIKPTTPEPKDTARVLVATRDIPANTEITADLIRDAFVPKDYPKDMVSQAVADLNPSLGKAFPTGVAKDQWVVPGMIGELVSKPSPRDEFVAPKPGPDTKVVEPVVPTSKKRYYDVRFETPTKTVIHRYEVLPNGSMQKVAELTPEQAAKDPADAPPAPTPAPAPDDKKRD